MLLFTLLPVVATIIGVFFSACSPPPGLKSALFPVLLMLAPPAIIYYNRDIILQWGLEEVEEKQWTGTRALGRPSLRELQIWEPPKCVCKYTPTAEMAEVLSGESAIEDIPTAEMAEVLSRKSAIEDIPTAEMAEVLSRESAFEDMEVRGTAYTLTIPVTTPTKASVTLTTMRTTRVTVSISTTTIMTTTAAPPPTYTPRTIVTRPTRSLIDIICESLGRRFGTTIMRIPLLWCIRAIFWMIPSLLLNSIDTAAEYLMAWLRNRPHHYSHRSTRGVDPLLPFQALYTFATFVYSWKLTMDFTRRGGDVVIFEALMPYVIEPVKWVVWAYNMVELCFFTQGIALAMLSHFSPWALQYCPPDLTFGAKAHFDMDPDQTIFSQVSFTYPLAVGYSSYYNANSAIVFSFMFLVAAIYSRSENLDRRRLRVRTGHGGDLPGLIPTRLVSFMAYCAKVLFAMIDRHKVISRAWVSLSGTLCDLWATRIDAYLDSRYNARNAALQAVQQNEGPLPSSDSHPEAQQAVQQNEGPLPSSDAHPEAQKHQEEEKEGGKEHQDNSGEGEDGNLSGEDSEQSEYEDEEENISGEQAEEGSDGDEEGTDEDEEGDYEDEEGDYEDEEGDYEDEEGREDEEEEGNTPREAAN
ncbi:hypothetical protein L211DRAFT_894016 [Terfezia boudieri ATCC MYA-4762]|uniref:Uncharacterized protein n=1 Tax=Terfezia boudieri ATCC MYA-4762 TaxID=1051890 RepID=A0A3N4LWQ6_9PEZI|nr:hypothetical protein L211DRAFT_894016 [Terfezia boudieri ATCC MYA-4762]